MGKTTLQQNRGFRRHWLAFGALAAVCWLVFLHPDVMETANHAYLLLDSLFSGRFAHFYTDVMAHENALYYLNNAHYTIVVYLPFALAELPVYLWNLIWGSAVNEQVLWFIGKLVSLVFFAACAFAVHTIAGQLSFAQADRHKAALLFALWPPAFFAAGIMGQYDSICLLFTLLGFLRWLQGRDTAASLWFGAGLACKFFPAVLFVPLLALRHKKPLQLLRYLALTLWLALPLALLYAGRGGDMGLFNQLMLERVFAARWPAALQLSVYPFLFGILCVVCYFWHPAQEKVARAGLWLCLASFGLLFLFVEWHPQWLLLLAPFVALTTFAEKNRLPFLWMDIGLSASFFILCALKNPAQLEANLLDFGLVGLVSGVQSYEVAYNSLSFYYALVPVLAQLAFPVFAALLACGIALKFPLGAGSLADRLWGGAALPAKDRPLLWVWLCFGAGLAVWALPTAFTWLKVAGVL